MNHDIPEHIRNSDIEYCISEYVRIIEHRDILRDWWFHGYTLEGLAAKYNKSVTSIKSIVYNIGDKVLLQSSILFKK